MHSILDHILPTCNAKFYCESLSLLPLRLWVRPVPSPKPFKNVYREHPAGPWLTQCNKIMQKSVGFNRSLLFNPCRGVFATSFWSPTGSSGSCVCLKRWNHQFSERKSQWFALRTAGQTSPKSATWAWFVGLLALQIGVKTEHLAAAWAFKIVATAMRAEQVALFGGQSGPTSTCLVNSHYVLGGGWEMRNQNV